MPTNLNALIRYKTIDRCLSGARKRYSIRELMDACSEALAEARGRYSPVSERTLRDDIRIMRSDILDFNAPIRQENGLYFYDDPHYSILGMRISDLGIAERIYKFLSGLRDEIENPELEKILSLLQSYTTIREKNILPDRIRINERPAREKLATTGKREIFEDSAIFMAESADMEMEPENYSLAREPLIFHPDGIVTWGSVLAFL